MLAPVILFTYNRIWHTQQTIEALRHNELAEQSDLIIFSDAAKDERDEPKVEELRKYLKTIDGFKSIRIIERDNNWGLARSIIEGVTEVINLKGKVIVLEDDIVTSPAFLRYMNQALDYYENEPKVWHISGWNYPIDQSCLEDVFFCRLMNCWGWATWGDRWTYFEKNPQQLIDNWSKQQKQHFDLDGSGSAWYQVTANADGRMNTWAIFWYATIYENKGLCINPAKSYVENIGQDGSGVHCTNSRIQNSFKSVLCTKTQLEWPKKIQESVCAIEAIKQYYKKQRKPLFERLITKVSSLFFGK